MIEKKLSEEMREGTHKDHNGCEYVRGGRLADRVAELEARVVSAEKKIGIFAARAALAGQPEIERLQVVQEDLVRQRDDYKARAERAEADVKMWRKAAEQHQSNSIALNKLNEELRGKLAAAEERCEDLERLDNQHYHGEGKCVPQQEHYDKIQATLQEAGRHFRADGEKYDALVAKVRDAIAELVDRENTLQFAEGDTTDEQVGLNWALLIIKAILADAEGQPPSPPPAESLEHCRYYPQECGDCYPASERRFPECPTAPFTGWDDEPAEPASTGTPRMWWPCTDADGKCQIRARGHDCEIHGGPVEPQSLEPEPDDDDKYGEALCEGAETNQVRQRLAKLEHRSREQADFWATSTGDITRGARKLVARVEALEASMKCQNEVKP